VSRSGARSAAETATAFRRVTPPRGLTHEVVDRIAADIRNGKLRPGARLPTEQEMMAALGVSRTVVREAVAALRAEGLVATRQGVGAFVREDARARPFRIDSDGLGSIGEVLNVMELRTGIEIEAAGLAAERAGPSDIDSISAALDAIDGAIDRGELAIDEDFAFHHGIAEATGNPQFPRFLEFLGRIIIPRQSVRVATPRPRAYLRAIQAEHRRIFEAIRRRNAGAAQEAMRRHLLNGRERYRKLAASAAPKP
jgi:GntR family transcriptional regulator, transcriptional repressor for pyruvate dehydrogenase complex